jgi:hypothetical protein
MSHTLRRFMPLIVGHCSYELSRACRTMNDHEKPAVGACGLPSGDLHRWRRMQTC